MDTVKQYESWNYNSHWYLVEMLLNLPAYQIDWLSFGVPDQSLGQNDWQCPYMEQYLNKNGTERICGVYERPDSNADSCRVAFFIYKDSETVLRTPYGEFKLDDSRPAPERLRSILEFSVDFSDIYDQPLQNIYPVTWHVYCSWSIEKLFKGIRLILLLIFCLLAGLSFGRVLSGTLQPLFFVLTLVCLYYAFFRDIRRTKRAYDSLVREYGQYDWIRTITLEKDRIVLEEGTASSIYAYSDIKNAVERKTHFRLIMRDGNILYLYKNVMQNGTPDDCWTFIEKQMDRITGQ